MINLRYHIVSITAVFLALGIGIAMGSSFLGAAAVDRVDANVRNASNEAAAARSERDAVNDELSRRDALSVALREEGAETLFTNDLTDVPVLIITVGGVDDDSLDTLRIALESSRAALAGVLRIEDKVLDEGAADELATTLGVTATGAALRDDMVAALAADLRAHGATPTGSPGLPIDPPAPVAVRALIEAGFLGWEPGPEGVEAAEALSGGGYRYVVVTGAVPDVPDADVLAPLVESVAAVGPAPVVVASAATGADEEEREATRVAPLAFIRDDDVLRDRISTVDDLETFAGIAAVVQAVDELAGSERGQYGLGDGHDSLLPPA